METHSSILACSSPHSIFIVVDFPSLMDHSHQQKKMLPYLIYLKISSLDLKNSSGYCCIFLISFASKLLEAFSYSSPLPLLTSSLEPTPPNLCRHGSYQWPLCCHFNGTSPLPQWFTGKEPTCQCRRCGFDPSVRKISWSRKWQLTPVFLSGKSHR